MEGTLQHVQHPDLTGGLDEVRLVEAVLAVTEINYHKHQLHFRANFRNFIFHKKKSCESQTVSYHQLKFLLYYVFFSKIFHIRNIFL